MLQAESQRTTRQCLDSDADCRHWLDSPWLDDSVLFHGRCLRTILNHPTTDHQQSLPASSPYIPLSTTLQPTTNSHYRRRLRIYHSRPPYNRPPTVITGVVSVYTTLDHPTTDHQQPLPATSSLLQCSWHAATSLRIGWIKVPCPGRDNLPARYWTNQTNRTNWQHKTKVIWTNVEMQKYKPNR